MSESWDQYAEGWDSNADVILYSKKAYDALCEILSLEGLTILDCNSLILPQLGRHNRPPLNTHNN